MLFFRQRDFRAIDEARHDEEEDRHSEHDELEVPEAVRRDVGGRGAARHADPDGDHADDAARDGACELVNERTHAEADRFVAMAELQLAILDGVRDRHEDDEEQQRLRQGEETSADERHRDIRAAHRIDDERKDHDEDRGKEQLAAAELRRQCREESNSNQADDRIDDAEDRELRGITNDIDEVVEVEVVDDVDAEAIDEVRDGHPEKLVILRQNFEDVFCRRVRLVLAQCAVLLLRADAEDDSAERCDAAADAGESKPAGRIARAAILIDGEIEDDRHDDDRDELAAEDGTDTGDRRRDLALMGIERQRWDHRPDGDVLCTVENIHDEVNDCKEDQIRRRARSREAAEVREQCRERDRCDERADENPRLETTPARLRLVDDVADEWIDEQLCDAQHEDDRRDNADHVLVMARVAGIEQVARDEDHEVRREHCIEYVVTERAACVCDARPYTAFALCHFRFLPLSP